MSGKKLPSISELAIPHSPTRLTLQKTAQALGTVVAPGCAGMCICVLLQS
jgi:hypothetical protein